MAGKRASSADVSVESEIKPKHNEKHIAFSSFNIPLTSQAAINPWTSVETIKSSTSKDLLLEFHDKTDLCRFFYKTEPVVSTVINKLVEIGINDLIFKKNKLSDNEFRIYTALKPRLLEFAEVMAQEYLLSGLVVPAISYGKIGKDELMDFGIKKYQGLMVPTSMFIRDPKTIIIKSSLLSDMPGYYVLIPDEVIRFIKDKGKYPDGREDIQLYENLKTYFPEFVKAVEAGQREIQVDPEEAKLSMRRKYVPENPYPIPYVSPVLDALQHKRQLRRMDYSIIDKIISAILHISVGSDDFPVTESDEDQEMIATLRGQLAYRFNNQQNLERIFQLLTNHTVKLEWIFPDSQILLDVDKYKDINQEVLFGLGFPQILITGESSKTGSSDPEIAMISPVKTMENFRRKIIKVIREICKQVAIRNSFSTAPEVEFSSLNLHAFAAFMTALQQGYANSAISRTSFADALGKDFTTELDKLIEENDALQSSGLPQVGPSPFSGNIANPNSPNPTGNNGSPIVDNKTTTSKPKGEQKPPQSATKTQ